MKERLKNKKVIAGIAAIVVIAIALVVFVFMNQSSLKVKSKEVVIEYGNQISLKAEDYLDEDNEKVIKNTTASIKEDVALEQGKDYYPVGEYTLVLNYDKESTEVKIIVKDTTAPEFKDFKDTVETVKDVKPEFNKLYIAEDLSKTEIIVDDQNVKYDTVGEYKATVKATDTSKNEVSKEITVKVIEPTIKLDKSISSLYVKETVVLKVEIKGKEDKATYKSSDDTVATVDSNGKVTAKKKGTATITAEANGVKAECKITVKETPKGSNTTTKKDKNGNTVTVVTPPNSSSGGSGSSGGTAQTSPKISMEAINLINNERAKLGLTKLTYNSTLADIALKRAKEIQKDFSHNGFDKYNDWYNDHTYGEVLTMRTEGFNFPAKDAVSNWMNSKAHKNILMDEDNTQIAVAYLNNRWVGVTR